MPLPPEPAAHGQTSQSLSLVSPRPAREGYKPTPDQARKIGRVKERVNFQTRESSRWALERQIFECIAFYCLDADTPVLLPDFTEKPLGAIRAGEYVLAVDEQASVEEKRHWRVAMVGATRTQRKPCLQVTLEDGRVLVGTADHRVLAHRPGQAMRWVQMGDLDPGRDSLVAGYEPLRPSLAADRGYLAGFLDGEGTLRGIQAHAAMPKMGLGAMAFAQNPGPVMQHVQDLCARLGILLGPPQKTGTANTITHQVRGGSLASIGVLREVPALRLRAGLRAMIDAGAITAHHLPKLRIAGIEPAGEREVVDIQTDAGTFIANGMVVHNCGIQWLEYSESTKRLQRWSAPSWFPTPVTNLIAPRVQVMVSHLTRSRPQGRVRPSSNEPSDREAAAVAEKLLTHLYQVTKEESIRTKAALIATLTGTVIAEDMFNPRAGKALKVPRTRLVEKPVVDIGPMGEEIPKLWPDGRPVTEQVEEDELDENDQPIVDEFRDGEIESRVFPLFNFYWDPKATCLSEARWCGEVSYMDLDWIDDNFPEFGPMVASEEGVDGMNFYEASLLSLVGPSIQGTAHYGGTYYYQHGAAVRKYFEKPSQEYPEGLYLIVAGDVLLYDGTMPIRDELGNVTGDFPYTEFRYDEVPGRFAGRTPVEDMVPPQKRVNGIDAQVILNRKTLLNPWVLAPKGSGLDPGRVAMRPGATVLYNFIGVGAAPQVVHGVPLPQQVMEERTQAIQAMDALVQDAGPQAQQSLPPGVKSGIALNFLRELQQEQLMPRLNRWGQWVAERDRKRLLLAQQHYREERAVKLLGVGSDWQVKYWKGSDLRGNTDVTIDQGSLIPKAQSVKTQTIFDGVENGFINAQDPVQRQKLLEELGLTDFEDNVGPDHRRAQKENAQMDDGIPVEVTQFEDKQLHLLTHVMRVKDPSFDSLAPEVQQLHLQHITMTQQAIQAEEMQAQMQAEADMSRRLMLAERAQAVGVQIGDLENPQGISSNTGNGEQTAA